MEGFNKNLWGPLFERERRTATVLNIAGIAMVLVVGILNELGIPSPGGLMAGILLWLLGEVNVLRSLLESRR